MFGTDKNWQIVNSTISSLMTYSISHMKMVCYSKIILLNNLLKVEPIIIKKNGIYFFN